MKALIFLFLYISCVVANASASNEKWYEKIEVGGDFRYRHEYIDKEEQGGSNHRQRIRARLKTQGKVNDDVKIILQLATGNLEATSTNQSLDGTYNNKNFELDMAYMEWSAYPSVNVLAGKVRNTFFSPGDSELIWDADLTPEGVAVNWKCKCDEKRKYFANFATYWYEERDGESTTGGSDTIQYSIQAGSQFSISNSILDLGIGHHVFAPIEGHAVLGATKGNSLDGSNQYLNGYETSEAFLAWSPSQYTITLYFHYLLNGAAGAEDTAYLAGFIYGKAKEEGDWSFDYNYRDTEADAVLGYLSDGDFADGETNSRGHKIKIQYQLGESSTSSLMYLVSKRNVSTMPVDYNRGQLDFIFKF